MAAPSTTKNAAGNVIPSSTTVSPGAGNQETAVLDLTTKFGANLHVAVGFGPDPDGDVAVICRRGAGSTPQYESDSVARQVSIPYEASTTVARTIWLPGATQWEIAIQNNDSTDDVDVEATSDVFDAIS